MEAVKEKNKNIFVIALILILIVVGIIVVVAKGFNKELKYQETQSIDVYLEQEFDKTKVKEIANEILGNNIVETVEIYEDMITVRAKTITEEQKDNFVNKLKENYEFKQTAEDTTIKTIPQTEFKDLYIKYILPLIIAEIVVLIYMVIRYQKIGILNVIGRTVIYPIIGELLLASIIAITRIPVGRFTSVLFVLAYIGTIIYVINKNQKDNDAIIEDEEK